MGYDKCDQHWRFCLAVFFRSVFEFESNYLFTIKFIQLGKGIFKSLDLGSGFEFLEEGFDLGLLEKPYLNSLSNNSRSCGVISDTFFPEN